MGVQPFDLPQAEPLRTRHRVSPLDAAFSIGDFAMGVAFSTLQPEAGGCRMIRA